MAGTTFTSTAYATMKGHLLKGEERVTVALRDNHDQDVDVEIVSISRPANTPIGKGLWPFIGRKQTNFFELQMDFLKAIGRKTGQPSSMDSFIGMEGEAQRKEEFIVNNKCTEENNKNISNNNKGNSIHSSLRFPVNGVDDHPSHFDTNIRLGETFDL